MSGGSEPRSTDGCGEAGQEALRAEGERVGADCGSVPTPPRRVFDRLGERLFGLLAGLIGCGSGMRAPSTADGVGVAATRAVVGGIVAIAVSDGLLAVLCYVWNL